MKEKSSEAERNSMKRFIVGVLATFALLFGTSAMPAHAVEVGCKSWQTTQRYYTHAPYYGYMLVQSLWVNNQNPLYIFIGAAQFDQPSYYLFYSDHNVELGNGVKWGFRVQDLNGQQPEQPPYWGPIITKTWIGAGGVIHHCSWTGTSYISGGTLVSGTMITYSD